MFSQYTSTCDQRSMKSVFQVTSTCCQCSMKDVVVRTLLAPAPYPTPYIYIYISKLLQHVINVRIKSVFRVTSTCYQRSTKSVPKILQHVINVASRSGRKKTVIAPRPHPTPLKILQNAQVKFSCLI